MKQFSTYLTEKTLRLHYKYQPVIAVMEVIGFYCENNTKLIVTLCGAIAY